MRSLRERALFSGSAVAAAILLAACGYVAKSPSPAASPSAPATSGLPASSPTAAGSSPTGRGVKSLAIVGR